MSFSPRWIGRQALLLMHEESLSQFGGARGLRDPGMLDSALSRPENKFLYEPESTVYLLAAAYCFGIARNHPFVDGNKRAALLAIIMFFRDNGYRLRADTIELEMVVLEVASGMMDEGELARWLREHTVPTV